MVWEAAKVLRLFDITASNTREPRSARPTANGQRPQPLFPFKKETAGVGQPGFPRKQWGKFSGTEASLNFEL